MVTARDTIPVVREWSLILLVACSYSSAPSSTDSTPGDDVSTETDNDGDGVENATDNCADIANQDQRDHDNDTRGDLCDLCPHLATTDDPDSDGDLVGDACDPRPTTSGDSVAFFVGFYDNEDLVGWTVDGTWTVEDGTVRNTDAMGLDGLSPPSTFTRASLQARVIVDTTPNPGGSTSSVHIISGATGPLLDPDTGHLCGLRAPQSSSPTVFAQTRTDPATSAESSASWPGPTDAVTLDVRLDLAGSQHVCSVAGTPPATATQDVSALSGTVTLFSQRSTLQYDYLFVVETGL